jgi:AcrR family transcriptional regulator
MPSRPHPSPRNNRFARRQTQIIDAAARHINLHGVRGMTLTAVAGTLNLDTSSITYYFKRKDMLAAACLEKTQRWLLDAAQRAAAKPDPRARARHMLSLIFDLHARQREPGAAQLALLSDIGALDAPIRAPLDALSDDILATVRGFFDRGPGAGEGSRTLVAATYLTESILWLSGWIDRYHVRDFGRVEARLFDLLDRGLGNGGDWPFHPIMLTGDENEGEAAAEDSAQVRFLRAATRLINRHGYRGASVERIAAELGVSTGSFYHHLANKDDLVVACFQRSFGLIEQAQARADQRGANERERIAIMASALTSLQFANDDALLRTSAYQALPFDLRSQMLHLNGQVTRHIAGTIADGIAEKSLRAVDPVIASQFVTAAINRAADLREWAATGQPDDRLRTYLAPLANGIFR